MTKPSPKAKKPRQTYATKSEALLALYKQVFWNPSEYQAVFRTDDGRYFFTLDENENFDLLEEYDMAGKKYYNADDDDGYVRIYDREVKKAFDKLVPRTHPYHAYLWRHHKDDLTSCADGLGGMTDPDAVVEDYLGWIRRAKEIWIEEISKLPGYDKTAPVKGKYPHELAGISLKKWRACQIFTEDEYREFIQAWASDELTN